MARPKRCLPAEHKGVIPPPDIGDEDIHTDVPNPEAGHEEEVIPPSDVPAAATPLTFPRASLRNPAA